MRHRANLIDRSAPETGDRRNLPRPLLRPVIRWQKLPVAGGLISVSQDNRHTSLFSTSSELPQQFTTASGRPMRAVIVEDEGIIALDIEMSLQDLGVEVVGVAVTAAEAVRLAELHRPDCVTMDINIKGARDGISAAIEIYETLGIRAIFISAYGNQETRVRAGRAHPHGWLAKPLVLEELRMALARVLSDDSNG